MSQLDFNNKSYSIYITSIKGREDFVANFTNFEDCSKYIDVCSGSNTYKIVENKFYPVEKPILTKTNLSTIVLENSANFMLSSICISIGCISILFAGKFICIHINK